MVVLEISTYTVAWSYSTRPLFFDDDQILSKLTPGGLVGYV